MSVEVQCPCGKRLMVSTGAAGGQGRCPACGRVLDLPAPEQGAPPALVPSRPVDTSVALTDDPAGRVAERTAMTEAAPGSEGGEGLAGKADEVRSLAPPEYRLASPGQVGLVGFLGGPLGAFLLMARNYARCGRRAACRATVAAGVLVTAVPVGFGLLLPDVNPGFNLCFAVPLWMGTYMTAKVLQERTFEDHRKRGGRQASGWAVVGFTVLGIALTLGPVMGAAALYEVEFGDQQLRVTDKEVIYYGRDVTEAEARTLGRVLRERGFFDGVGEKSVWLRKEGQDYVVSVALLFGFDDPHVSQQFRDLARQVSSELGGKPVRVELCDTWETPKKKLPPERGP